MEFMIFSLRCLLSEPTKHSSMTYINNFIKILSQIKTWNMWLQSACLNDLPCLLLNMAVTGENNEAYHTQEWNPCMQSIRHKRLQHVGTIPLLSPIVIARSQ